MASKVLDDVVSAAEEDNLLPKKQSLVQHVLHHLRNHRILSYGGVSAIFAPVATGAGYFAGANFPVEGVMANMGLDSLSSFGTAAVTVTTSTLTKLVIDAIAPQQLLYLVNKDIYSEEAGGWGSFAKRYTGFNLAARAIEGATGFFAIAIMLTHQVPYATAVFTNGTATSPFNSAAKFFLYHLIVLKENPLPKLRNSSQQYASSAAEFLLSAPHAAQATAKRLTYQFAAFMTSARIL